MWEPYAIDIELFPTGDDTSGYRTRNHPSPSRQNQRTLITNREGVIFSKCTMKDVVHGRLGEIEGSLDDPATLIVLKFEFGSSMNKRRIKAARIKLQFIDSNNRHGEDREDPNVLRMYPEGDFRLTKTSHILETKTSGGLNLGAPPIVGLQAGGQITWEETRTRQVHDSVRLHGRTALLGMEHGDVNTAIWTLLENHTDKTGVPAELCVSVLLTRHSDRPFQCIFEMELELDTRSALEKVLRVMGKRNVDDPILFDPATRPTKKQLEIYPVDRLVSTDLRLSAEYYRSEDTYGHQPTVDDAIDLQHSKEQVSDEML